jgi:hypothetical protein
MDNFAWREKLNSCDRQLVREALAEVRKQSKPSGDSEKACAQWLTVLALTIRSKDDLTFANSISHIRALHKDDVELLAQLVALDKDRIVDQAVGAVRAVGLSA